MTTTKLHIDMSLGVIDLEGDPDLVREIYRDMKDHLLKGAPITNAERRDAAAAGVAAAPEKDKSKSRRRASARRKADGESASPGISADAPKLDKNLDTSKLAAFYGEFEAKNNFEKILIFLKFITEELGIENPNTDQVYTCYKKTGEKIPKAFAQAFRDTSTKHGYIDFRSPTDIAITIAGDNHFNHVLKKKGAE